MHRVAFSVDDIDQALEIAASASTYAKRSRSEGVAPTFVDVYDDAVAWAESVLGDQVAEVVPLSGGMTSTMLALTESTGRQSVLRLMTNEPWRTHGAELTRRERAAQSALASTPVPAPASLGLDADGTAVGVAAHLMSRVPVITTVAVDDDVLIAMADMLATIHDVRPAEPFRTYQSWAWEAKWVVPAWARHPDSWQRAFGILAADPPAFTPTFLHRDYSHRNLLWIDGVVSGVVDWVEASTGPAWLDAGHAATNLAVAFGPEPAWSFLAAYAAVTARRPGHLLVDPGHRRFPPPSGKGADVRIPLRPGAARRMAARSRDR